MIRQILTETLVLALAAGGFGLAIGAWLPGALIARVAKLSPRIGGLIHPAIDQRVFLWCLLVSVLACFAFGLVPALQGNEARLRVRRREDS